MYILSLFDGISCGFQAFKQAGLKVDYYFASEIDSYAIKIAKKNHPEIFHLGNIKNWKNWGLPKIDMIIGGSPCQGFSFAGKQLNFKDSRSSLFFEFLNCITHFKPKNFLLENVKMQKKSQNIISNLLNVEPVEINSSLVSAQNRRRLYWCNQEIKQPKDKKVLLKDVVDSGEGKGVDNRAQRTMVFKKNYCQWDLSGKGNNSQDQRAFYLNGKHGTLPSDGGSSKVKVLLSKENRQYRKLTPTECERLQTLPDNYTEGVSNAQRYKMIGNGWTIAVIEHILKEMDFATL